MDIFLQFLPVIVVALIFYLLVKFKPGKLVEVIPEKDSTTTVENKTFEEKTLILQEEANKRLKGIDSTLNWFFWIMIISFLFYVFYAFMSSQLYSY